MNWQDPINFIGLLGVFFMLLGIWRTSMGRWSHHSALYELDTIIGAGLLLIYQYNVGAYIVMPINIAYVFVSFVGLSSYAERYAARQKHRQMKSKRKHW